MLPRPPRYTLFPYTTLFRSQHERIHDPEQADHDRQPEQHEQQVEELVQPLLLVLLELALRCELRVRDRKSTRLNSSHMSISYAVFCLKKKKEIRIIQYRKCL